MGGLGFPASHLKLWTQAAAQVGRLRTSHPPIRPIQHVTRRDLTTQKSDHDDVGVVCDQHMVHDICDQIISRPVPQPLYFCHSLPACSSPTNSPMTDSKAYAIQLADIEAAADRISVHVHCTPVMTCLALDDMAGKELFFKCEMFQKRRRIHTTNTTNDEDDERPNTRREYDKTNTRRRTNRRDYDDDEYDDDDNDDDEYDEYE
eukprot:gene23582-9110_t